MKIAVIGAGAIGGLVAAYLKLSGAEVSLVGHPDAVSAIRSKGLQVSGARGARAIAIDASQRLQATPDLAILATKTQDLEAAIEENLESLRGATILTTQNGIRGDEIAGKYLPPEKIISSIVMFGSTLYGPAKIVHNFEGSWIIGKAFGKNDRGVVALAEALQVVAPTLVTEDIRGMKYLKVFVNANNCIPAILGKSMQESFSDAEISRISIGIWKEGMEVIRHAGITLVSLPDFPLERLLKLIAMPAPDAAKVYSGIMMGLSKEPLYGSILQSIQRGKSSEIDYINGEFVALAQEHNGPARLNAQLVAMVHQVEREKKFFTKDQLLTATKGMYN